MFICTEKSYTVMIIIIIICALLFLNETLQNKDLY